MRACRTACHGFQYVCRPIITDLSRDAMSEKCDIAELLSRASSVISYIVRDRPQRARHGMILRSSTVGTRVIGPCARTLELPLLVWSGVFFFFLLSQGADFWCVFRPFSGGGNFGLHSTWSDYSSSYGSLEKIFYRIEENEGPKQER